MICPICGTPKQSQRKCCKSEFTRLRSKLGRVHEVLDKTQGERDRLSTRVGLKQMRDRVMELDDPWAEEAS